MYRILQCRSGIWPFLANPALAKFTAVFPDLLDMCTGAVHIDHLQLKIIKLVLTRDHLSE